MSQRTTRNKRRNRNIRRTTPKNQQKCQHSSCVIHRQLTQSERELLGMAETFLKDEGIYLPNIDPTLHSPREFGGEELWVAFPGEISAYPEKRVFVITFLDCRVLLGYSPAIETLAGPMGTLVAVRRVPRDTSNEELHWIFNQEWNSLEQ